MSDILLIIPGMVIGFIVAFPIGPVNLICIRRTLQFGFWTGFISGLGAALGDGLYAAITGFGLTAVSQLIQGFSTILQLVGGILLLSFGIHTYNAKPVPRVDIKLSTAENGKSTVARTIASTFALTISNPATLMGFTAIFAGLGGLAGDRPSFLAAAFVVSGVFAGSTLWWLTLTTVVGLLHARIDEWVGRVINKVSGLLVAAFGLTVLGHLLIEYLLKKHGHFW